MVEFQKNQICEVVIEDMGNDGEGIGKTNGYPLFVKDALIGDRVKVRITKAKKNYAYARLEKILEPSPYRTEPVCKYHRQCGGCQIQAMEYQAQLAFKQKKVRNDLLRIGGFSAELLDAVMEPIVGMEEPWHYRNKAQFPIGEDKDGQPIAGFYAGRTHSIIANTDCALGVPENREVLEIVLDYMKAYCVPAYDEETGEGLLRHVLIRKGFASGQIMVCLVAAGTSLPHEDELILALRKIPGMTSVCLNINRENTNVILGRETKVLWGSGSIEDRLLGITFRISAQSFYQVNPEQTEKLYSTALKHAGLTGTETVWDLYCGIGTISLFLAKHAGKVYGVEVVPQAVLDARENARINGIENVEFIEGKAEEVLPAFYAEESVGHGAVSASKDMRYPDVIVVDPPRKGCDEACLTTMLRMMPDRIVYVSCDSATLARDLKILCAGGYELRRVCPVDQFAHTVHVECACALHRRDT